MKTVFIRALEPSVENKAGFLRQAIAGSSPVSFEVELDEFREIPRSPFAYWISPSIRKRFSDLPRLEGNGRTAKQGVATADDFRFVRLATEVDPAARNNRWFPFAKGGAFSRFYADVHLVVDWNDDGVQIRNLRKPGSERIASRPQNTDFYFLPGLTWSDRTTKQFSTRAWPAGGVFSVKGSAGFFDGQELFALAVTNSKAFNFFLSLLVGAGDAAARSYQVGTIGTVPWPPADDALAGLARHGWSLKRELDKRAETSHAFSLPSLLQSQGNSLVERADSWARRANEFQSALLAIVREIDDGVFRLYKIPEPERRLIEEGFTVDDTAPSEPQDVDEDDVDDDSGEENAEVDAAPMVASLLSWTLGVAFGRFDVRLATGKRDAPPEPEPFDPLPVCSPGMLTRDDGLPVAAPPSGYPLTFPPDGILVDDPGHPRDVVRAVRSVFEAVFDEANARWHEAAELLGAPDLRTWFARDFFEPHIKRYSKSRRKAPIYWQLATASGSYSVWLYIHRATGDTLFRVLNDFVGPKLDHEKAKLDGLGQEAGANPSAAQRREIEQQETFVGELQALKAEVARVAPLWKPNLDDGVILNFAPLWRLVPQSRSWQGECKKAWDKLVAGDYDWAHLAMHLWPERVVPKCQNDRSLAIAHGLDDVFWHEDDSGTWRKSRVDDATVQRLIQERTSTTVKAALKDLLSAAAPTASKGRKAKGRSASPRTSAPKPAPAAARTTTPDTALDEASLRAVKAAIASVADGASKADVLAATGLSDSDWNKAIAALLDRGDVTRTGQKRGTRYHADSPGEDG